MSFYYASFTYLGQNSSDLGWNIVHVSGDSDNGETDSFLSTSTVGTDMYNGTKRLMYGSKYDNSANIKITVVKRDGTDFGISDNRKAFKWLTGAQQNSWMYVYIGNEDRKSESKPGDNARFRLLGHVQDVKQYKLDAGVWGLCIYYELASPWAFSPMQIISQDISGTSTITIENGSDDQYTYTPCNVTFKNSTGSRLIILNNNTGESTEVSGLVVNETICLKDNMIITSDNPYRVFGNLFNYVFPSFKSGTNELTITGTGNITFEYYYCIKLGDCCTEINAVADPICDEEGSIQVDTLDWSRISNTPTTYQAYGITNVYSKAEVNNLLADIQIDETELSAMLKKELD